MTLVWGVPHHISPYKHAPKASSMSPKHGLDSTLLLPHRLSYKVPVPVLPAENRNPGVGDGQGGLACCSSWGRKESDMTEWLNWTEGFCMCVCVCHVCQWEGNGAPGEVPAQTSVLPAGWNGTWLTILGFPSHWCASWTASGTERVGYPYFLPFKGNNTDRQWPWYHRQKNWTLPVLIKTDGHPH